MPLRCALARETYVPEQDDSVDSAGPSLLSGGQLAVGDALDECSIYGIFEKQAGIGDGRILLR